MVTIRPREPKDLEQCCEALKAVYKTNGYPVGGVENAKGFLTEDKVITAWIAELQTETQVREQMNLTVIGHVAISKANEDDVSVALWWRLHPGDRETGKIAVLGRLFVHPDARKGGTATRLIEAAVSHARAQGWRLVMFALVKDQLAIALYGKLGWQRFGETVFRWGKGESMDAICFASPEGECG